MCRLCGGCEMRPSEFRSHAVDLREGKPQLGGGPNGAVPTWGMTSLQDMPQVQTCAVSSCSYNAESSCHAGAITVGGDHAHCGTFVEISFRGGFDRNGMVGACHRSDCVHNDKLECHAPGVRVGPGTDAADCLTYEAR